MTVSIPRSKFVAAVEEATDDPRLIEQAKKQESFAIGAWETTDPKTGKPCGCVVGEFIFNVKADRTLDNDSIEAITHDVRRTYALNLHKIGCDIDAAVNEALADYHEKMIADYFEKRGYDPDTDINHLSGQSIWGPVVYITED